MLWLVPLAEAHRPGVSYARIDGDALTITLARSELPEGEWVADAVVERGGPCEQGAVEVREVEGDGMEWRLPLRCPGGDTGTYTATFLTGLAPGHRHYVEAFGAPVAVLDATHLSTAFSGTSDTTGVALRFGRLGVEHIVTGYDHLAFLLALLLAAPGLRAMAAIVTGFTVAHSITLSAAALGFVSLPSAWVEPMIAASIVYVGLENFWMPSVRRRVVVTFVLGLVHGFGFAGLLAELGLPRGALALGLVSFNAGVELGQGAFVLVALPVLLLLRRTLWWPRYGVPAGSIGIVLAGVWWLVERS